MDPVVSVRCASYRYPGGGLAVDGVDWDVFPGQVWAVVGPNGSGKSTLARLLNGLRRPTAGRVVVAGWDTADLAATFAIRTAVGLVFENPDNQLVATTVEEEVAFAPENLGLPVEEIRRRVDAALAATGLAGRGGRPTYELSGGQKQRLAIADALAMAPRCLVLDEATSMLDPVGRREVLDVVLSLRERHDLAVVNITHHMEEAALADAVLVMAGGRVVWQGSPRQLFGNPSQLVDLGLALPASTELARELAAQGWPVDVGALSVSELVTAVAALRS